MQKNFLLEVGCEEIPSRFLTPIFSVLEEKTREKLSEFRLRCGSIYCDGTMKRISLFIENLSATQDPAEIEVKGPPKAAAYDSKNEPTRTAFGFAASQGVKVEDLKIKKIDQKEYVFALKKEKVERSIKILKKLIPELLSSLYVPISMKWGNADFSFIRPIHYIAALYGSEKIRFTFAGIDSSDSITIGKLPNARIIKLPMQKNFAGYLQLLIKSGIVLERKARKKIITDAICEFEKKHQTKILANDVLLEEASNIVEKPCVLIGRFNKEFLNIIPKDVILEIIKIQQKCLPSLEENSFLIVADGKRSIEIIKGYEQVIDARLRDAKFFYDEDMKISFEENLEKLKRTIYFKGLGSMREKTNRVKDLSIYIAKDILNFDEDKLKIIERAAVLSKTDLASHMVSEFPALQGIMGQEYALKKGENQNTAKAIYEHYLPRFLNDVLPESLSGQIIGIADRLDLIAGCFSKGITPSGSQDPYGVRRAALGIVSIIIAKNLELPFRKIINKSIKLYEKKDEELTQLILDFIKQRFRSILENENIKPDICDAVLENLKDFVPQYCKAFIISKVKNEQWFHGIVLTQDRISRISKDFKLIDYKQESFIEDGEKEANEAFLKTKEIYSQYLEDKKYGKALTELSNLTESIEKYFEKILVMHEDEKIKNNRLAFLKAVEKLCLEFADFSKIVI